MSRVKVEGGSSRQADGGVKYKKREGGKLKNEELFPNIISTEMNGRDESIAKAFFVPCCRYKALSRCSCHEDPIKVSEPS